MLDARITEDGGILAYSYALVFETARGSTPVIKHSTRCTDLLVHVGIRWLVRHRQITRDDLT
jgi:hypothetical protein